MKIAVASGKGGTGKTTIATNLAYTLSGMNIAVQYLDCDVEEPNGHIFLKPEINNSTQVTVTVPQVDLSKCSGCGKCGQLCQYSAIVSLNKTAITFEQLCHCCGGCMRICPEKAIKGKQKIIGLMEKGVAKDVEFFHGKLEIGDVRTPELIKNVKNNIDNNKVAIIDAPPGTSCPVIETVKDVDFVLLVTEPTPFGLNDLKLAVDMVKELKLPMAVIVNRHGIGDDGVYQYCREENIEIVMKLQDQRKIARAYSMGKMIVDIIPDYQNDFTQLYQAVSEKLKSFNKC